MPPLELTPAQTRLALECGEIEILGRMPWSSNGTFLVTSTLDGVAVRAVYKPRRGERPLWDFDEGTLCHREVAAFELSASLGWNLVPETVLRDGPLGTGAVQRFVDHDPDEHYFTLLESHTDRFRAFAAFDMLANNADRKSGHCLLCHDDGVIVGIDHGLGFHEHPKLRTVIWDFAGEPIPDDILADVVRAKRAGFGRVGEHLSPVEFEALDTRAQALLSSKRFPDPDDSYRSFPWPLV